MEGHAVIAREYQKMPRWGSATPGRRRCLPRNDIKGSKTAGLVQSNRFLEFLGGAEGDLLARLDLDLLAGGGIAPDAGRALTDLEDAEANEADALTLLQMLGDPGHQVGQDGFRLLFGQFLILGDGRGQMLERDGRRGCCLLCHVGPSSLLITS